MDFTKNKQGKLIGIIILIVFLIIAFAVGMLYSEIKNAKDFCEEQNKSYSFEFGSHYCDDEKIGRYEGIGKKYWDYVKYHQKQLTINFSK